MSGGVENLLELARITQILILQVVPLQMLLQQLRRQVCGDAGPSMPEHTRVLGLAGAGIVQRSGWHVHDMGKDMHCMPCHQPCLKFFQSCSQSCRSVLEASLRGTARCHDAQRSISKWQWLVLCQDQQQASWQTVQLCP